MNMNRRFFWMCILAGGLLLPACSNDEPETANIPTAVQQAFATQFGDAKNVDWDIENGKYAVAEFYQNGTKNEAWYDLQTGAWQMTKRETAFASLPLLIQETFKASEYSKAPWRMENEVDILERKGVEKVYIIEVEKEVQGMETNVDLLFTEDGRLVKANVETEQDNDFNHYLPTPVEGEIDQWLKKNFPNASIVDIETERGYTVVDIIVDNRTEKEVRFDAQSNWVDTQWDIPYAQLSPAIKQTIQTSYPGYRIDNEATVIESATGITYEVELEDAQDRDKYVTLDETGKVISER